jgi:Spy/CpxP family protein refolding chaperone
MSMRRYLIAISTLMMLAAAMPAVADEEGKRAKVREKVRAFVVASLIERLDLDEATTAKLVPVLKRYHEQIAAVSRDAGEARRELRARIESGRADDAAVNQLIDRMLQSRAKISRLEEEMYQAARKVVTPIVAAKLVIVLPQIKRQVEKQIRRAARGPRGDGRGDGEDDGGGDF